MNRMTLDETLEIAAQSLESRLDYRKWCFAFSGGKDSSTTLIAAAHLMESGRLPHGPELHATYVDTRLELPPLRHAAGDLLQQLEDCGFQTRIVQPEMDERFYVLMLGRGYFTPGAVKNRWCTDRLKKRPMDRAQNSLAGVPATGPTKAQQEARKVGLATANEEKRLLIVTGMRLGESAARDARITKSCAKTDTECGQGWFSLESAFPTLAPILHWRACLVWPWLMSEDVHGFDCRTIAEAYGKTEDATANEEACRTGCFGCPVASEDRALNRVCRMRGWEYLEPLKEIRPLLWELRQFRHRLKMPMGSGTRKDGFVGPIRCESRQWALGEILKIQDRVNTAAVRQGRPEVWIIDAEEQRVIEDRIEAGTYPMDWEGDEPTASECLPMFEWNDTQSSSADAS